MSKLKQLQRKIDNEYHIIKDKILKKKPDEIFLDAYYINFINEMCCHICEYDEDSIEIDEKVINELLTKDEPLAYLYSKWMDYNIDFGVHQAYTDFINNSL